MNKPRSSNFGFHLKYNNHKASLDNSKILHHHQYRGIKMDLLEAYEITKAVNNSNVVCLNNQIEFNF